MILRENEAGKIDTATARERWVCYFNGLVAACPSEPLITRQAMYLPGSEYGVIEALRFDDTVLLITADCIK
jgi:hypothetical protein